MLTETQIRLIQDSYQHMSFQLIGFGERFYQHLFRMHPEVQPMFKTSMNSQSMKLMQMIGFAVSNLQSPESLRPLVAALGNRHRGYGVQVDHYGYVGDALMITLAEILGERFTPEAHTAWAQLYSDLVEIATGSAASSPA